MLNGSLIYWCLLDAGYFIKVHKPSYLVKYMRNTWWTILKSAIESNNHVYSKRVGTAEFLGKSLNPNSDGLSFIFSWKFCWPISLSYTRSILLFFVDVVVVFIIQLFFYKDLITKYFTVLCLCYKYVLFITDCKNLIY